VRDFWFSGDRERLVEIEVGGGREDEIAGIGWESLKMDSNGSGMRSKGGD
jgi:hypothetical protein